VVQAFSLHLQPESLHHKSTISHGCLVGADCKLQSENCKVKIEETEMTQ
jgi:hypothetical protein